MRGGGAHDELKRFYESPLKPSGRGMFCFEGEAEPHRKAHRRPRKRKPRFLDSLTPNWSGAAFA